MKKYNLISLVALSILVVSLPIYVISEAERMGNAQSVLRQRYIQEGATLYVENCIRCHGPDGGGVGAMPALDGLQEAEYRVLYRTIAHSPHGTAMSSWHLDQGGPLNDYEVEGLVTLIQNGGWFQVQDLAYAEDLIPVQPSATPPANPYLEMAMLEQGQGDPHECHNCHEEPDVHAGRFGLNCSRCHTLQAWAPALLTRHTFLLDHGDEGQVACQTCHIQTYSEYTCYECHDHQPEEMRDVHTQEGIYGDEVEDCARCHPTGQPDEGSLYMDGQAANPELDGLSGLEAVVQVVIELEEGE